MSEELVDFAKANRINPMRVNIQKLLEGTVKEIFKEAETKQVTVDISCPDGVSATLDAQKMSRVLANLMVNAIQAISRPQGHVVIAVRHSGEVLVITCADNGPGIAPEHLPHLFDSSFTYGKRRGTGFGLSYCQKVVDAHGGSISVESVMGTGTVFSIMLPIEQKQSGVQEETGTRVTCTRPQALPTSILVVDDDPSVRLHWRVLFKKYGIVPHESSSLEDLRDRLIDFKNVGLAIVDFQFEGSTWTGLDVINFLKKQGLSRIYLCTGFHEDADIRAEAFKRGVRDVLPKPFDETIIQKLV